MADASSHPSEGMAAPLGVPLHRLMREKRRAAGLSQQQLCAQVGITQSALSAFEREGESAHALSREHVVRLADILGIPLDSDVSSEGVLRSHFALHFCPDPECPATIAYSVSRDTTAYRPPLLRARTDRALHCGYCGEVCEKTCSNCGALVSAQTGGVCCPACGRAYVEGAYVDAAEQDRRQRFRDELRATAAVIDLATLDAGRPTVDEH